MVFTHAMAREAVARTIRWLREHQRSNGAVGNELAACYKVPYAFQVCGYNLEATRLLSYIKAIYMDATGDFGPEDYISPSIERRFHVYHNQWIILGAHRLGRFDIAYKAAIKMLEYQDQKSGGFSCDLSAGVLDILSTAFCGLTCIYLGRIEEARKAGDFLAMMLDLQPEIDHQLFVDYHPDEGLVTNFPESEALIHVVKIEEKRQWYFYPGASVAFLSKLYAATGSEKYLRSAISYFEFAMRCREDVFTYPTGGKLGWGSSCLFNVTGDKKYRDAAEKIASHLLETQRPAGDWPIDYLGDTPGSERERSHSIDISAEFAIWLTEISKELA
jgi:hypothetical protein